MQANKAGLVTEFLESEQTSGAVLMLTTILAIGWANSSMGPTYLAFWQQKIGFCRCRAGTETEPGALDQRWFDGCFFPPDRPGNRTGVLHR